MLEGSGICTDSVGCSGLSRLPSKWIASEHQMYSIEYTLDSTNLFLAYHQLIDVYICFIGNWCVTETICDLILRNMLEIDWHYWFSVILIRHYISHCIEFNQAFIFV